MKISFLGLGAMGYPMAGHLANAGYDVTVFNRTTSKAEIWANDYKGQFAKTVEEAVKDADVILTNVGNDNDVREIYDKIFTASKTGAILIDHTTTSAIIARELSKEAKEKGMEFLDAPVSGGQAGAENGVLTVMVGGEQQAFDTVFPILDTYAKAVTLIGDAGSGASA